MSLLEVIDIDKSYGAKMVLDGLSFDIEESTGILGANGSGKTTIIKLLSGIIYPDDGEIRSSVGPDLIRVIPENPMLPRNMPLWEWLHSLRELYGEPRVKISHLLEILDISEDSVIGEMSAGQKKKVSLLPVFFGKSSLVILDEPTNFLDIQSRRIVLTILKRFGNRSGMFFLVASHRLEDIVELTEKIYILADGVIDEEIPNFKDLTNYVEVRVGHESDIELMSSGNHVFKKASTTFLIETPDPRAYLRGLVERGVSVVHFKIYMKIDYMTETKEEVSLDHIFL